MIYHAMFALENGKQLAGVLVKTTRVEPHPLVMQRAELVFASAENLEAAKVIVYKDKPGVMGAGWTAPAIEEEELLKWISMGASYFQWHSNIITRRPIDALVH